MHNIKSLVGVGDGGGQGGGNVGGHVGPLPPSPQKIIPKKYCSANYYVKFGHCSDKNHVKFRNFANFSGKYHKHSGILIIFGQ